MPNPNVFRAAGALGARRRWQPGASEEELLADLQAARDEHLLDQVEERAKQLTPTQVDRLRRIFSGAP
jgi:hypothetical protein